MKTLYVHRKVLNKDDFKKYFKDVDMEEYVPLEELHLTVAFSTKAVDWSLFEPCMKRGIVRINEPLGTEGAKVMKIQSPYLKKRWRYYLDNGCSWKFPDYTPHIALTYNTMGYYARITPYMGEIILGPEIWKECNTKFIK